MLQLTSFSSNFYCRPQHEPGAASPLNGGDRCSSSRILFSPLAIIVFEFVGVVGDLHTIAVRIEKADRSIARDHQRLRTADNRNVSAFQDRRELFDDIIR